MTAGRIRFGARRAPRQTSLRAFFEGSGFAAQIGEHVAGEMEGGCGIVGAVDDYLSIPLLKTSGAFDGRESARNRLLVDTDLCSMNRCDRDGGVLFLIITG